MQKKKEVRNRLLTKSNIFPFLSRSQSKFLSIWQKSGFTSQSKTPGPPLKSSVTPSPPLSQPLPNLPTPVYSTAKREDQETKITTLSNGLKVATEDYFGQFCTIGGKYFNNIKIVVFSLPYILL